MTDILVTKFKMGQIDVKDLAEMARGYCQSGEVLGGKEGARGGEGLAGFPAWEDPPGAPSPPT